MKFPDYLMLTLIAMFSLNGCQSPTGPPNVLLIMTDDQGWGDFSSNGNPFIKTPRLDGLAASSISFDRFYVSPVCAPTRASLLTGRYHLRTGTTWVTHRKEAMRAEEVTLAESFRDQGYATGCFGKWHNGEHYPQDPPGQGFDEFFGFKAGHWNNYFDTRLIDGQKQVITEGYITDVLTDRAIDFMKRNIARPFFCYVPYNAPHGPFQVPDTYFNKYRDKGLDDKTACVYAMCENIDDNVGRMLDFLDSARLSDRTIVIFLTDNGPNGDRYNGNMKGRKGQVDEGGIRVPLYIRYPAVFDEPRIISRICSHIDIFPTLHDLCRLSLPADVMLDGRSLVPLMQGNEQDYDSARMIFTHQVRWEFDEYPGSVRTREHRLVLSHDGSVLLYDMLADPGQKNDISPDHPEITERLSAAYHEWLQDVTSKGVRPLPIPVGFPEAPVVHFPAPGGILSGNLRFQGRSGWANDWLVNFTTPGDSVYWPVSVSAGGTYSLNAEIACACAQQPAELVFGTPESAISFTLEVDLEAPYIKSPDRVDRGEVYERKWPVLEVGEITVEQDTEYLFLKIKEVEETSNIELKSLTINRL